MFGDVALWKSVNTLESFSKKQKVTILLPVFFGSWQVLVFLVPKELEINTDIYINTGNWLQFLSSKMRNILHKETFFQNFIAMNPPSKRLNNSPLPTQQRGNHRHLMPQPAHPDNFTTHPLLRPRVVLSSAQVSLV